ncbi:hypothetical protein GQ42DRAFT_59614 [Ramicandelaber brevisporus]|nr:hypothetical protein GQ42DRAFT_158268 [Ramicandelaber brevisporus]KAI8867222.1 hypothetical protein GQ42DRAFT_59614 [Ramicandelaber brevisporus]
MASPSAPNFIDACYFGTGPEVLISFRGISFLYFCLLTLVAGPFLFRLVAATFDWERHEHPSIIWYYANFLEGMTYMFIVFVVGNYASTLSWFTVLGYFVGLFGWALLGELSFLKVSLVTWRSWTIGAWIAHILAVLIVLGFAGVHLFYANQHDIIWPFYVVGLLVMGGLLAVSIAVWAIAPFYERRWPKGLCVAIAQWIRGAASWMWERLSRRSEQQHQQQQRQHNASVISAEIEGGGSGGNVSNSEFRRECNDIDTSAETSSNDANRVTSAVVADTSSDGYGSSSGGGNAHGSHGGLASPVLVAPPSNGRDPSAIIAQQPPALRYRLHLHHWQIFYGLAFFTRFANPVSQICAGLVLGIHTHGAVAYGYDSLLEQIPQRNA